MGAEFKIISFEGKKKEVKLQDEFSKLFEEYLYRSDIFNACMRLLYLKPYEERDEKDEKLCSMATDLQKECSRKIYGMQIEFNKQNIDFEEIKDKVYKTHYNIER